MDGLSQLRSALTGKYEVLREIGAGGMANVYLARDLRHDRQVAVKVLKQELGAVLGVERFLSEIRVTANLQHPNVLPLFDSGEADGLLFYVMPFVEGETLGSRLDRQKQLPIDEAIRISAAIAGALEYAHQRGVVHRDLKPDNVLLQSDQPVIADFGIALAVSNAGGARMTATGMSLGTPQYMSPEQAMGERAVDGRTDIYALGAITYQMLAGEPPHMGASMQSIIAKVVSERPPSVAVMRPSVSEEVAYAVDRALEKLPADRWSTAAEFADALKGKKVPRTFGSRAAQMGLRFTSKGVRALLGVTSLTAVLGVAGAAYLATRPTPAVVTGRFSITLPESVSFGTVTVAGAAGTLMALSRDGKDLVVVGERGKQRALYLRHLDDPVAQVVLGTDSASNPSFSPDGLSLLFKTQVALKMVSVGGGTPTLLADSAFLGSSWGDRGVLLFEKGDELWLGTSNGRDAKLLVAPDTLRHIYRYRWPEVLPGGTHALVTLDRSPGANVPDSLFLAVISLKDGRLTELGLAGSNARYAAPGRIVFGRKTNRGLASLYAAPFSLRSLKTTGVVTRLADDVWMGNGGAVGFAVSQTGVMAFREGQDASSRLVAVDLKGRIRALPGDAARFSEPRISPDGRHIAVSVREAGSEVVWIVDVATGERRRLTPDSSSIRPEWSRDGSRVAYLRVAPGPGFSRPWDGTGTQLQLFAARVYEIGVGARGGPWAFRRQPDGLGQTMQLFVAPEDTLAAMRPLVATHAYVGHPRISPDGTLLAFVSEETGTRQVYVQPFPGPGAKVSVSIAGGNEPIWSPDGATLYYRERTFLRGAELSRQPLRVVRRDSLFALLSAADLSHPNYDVFPNGREFLMLTPVTSNQRSGIDVIMNWVQATARSSRAP